MIYDSYYMYTCIIYGYTYTCMCIMSLSCSCTLGANTFWVFDFSEICKYPALSVFVDMCDFLMNLNRNLNRRSQEQSQNHQIIVTVAKI